MNAQRKASTPFIGPTKTPSINASLLGSSDSVGFFITGGGVVGEDLAVFINDGYVTLPGITISQEAWAKSFFVSADCVVLGPAALYATAKYNMYGINKVSGDGLWTFTNTGWDNVGSGIIGDGSAPKQPGTRLLGYAPSPSFGAPSPSFGAPARRAVATGPSPTKTPTRTSSQTPTNFNKRCGYESFLFHPVVVPSRGLLIAVSLRCVYGVDLATGTAVWYRTSGDIVPGSYAALTFTTSLTLSEDELTFCGGLSSGSIFCMQTADGGLLWTTRVVATSGGIYNPLTISNRTVFVHGPAAVAAYTLLGAQLWNTTVPSSTQPQVLISVLPAFVSPTVDAIAFTQSCKILVLSTANGTLLRTISTCSDGFAIASAIAVDAVNALFLVLTDTNQFFHTLYRVNATSGVTTFSVNLPTLINSIATPSYHTILVGNNALLVGDFAASLYVYT